jgi:hypothetical protein
MKTKNINLLLEGCLFLFLFVLLMSVLGYPVKAKLFPLIMIISSMVLLGILIFADFTKMIHERRVQEADRSEDESSGNDIRGLVDATVWISASLFGFLLFGHILICFLLPLAYGKFHKESWLTSISLSIGCGVIFYLVFVTVLDMRLYEGFLFSLY